MLGGCACGSRRRSISQGRSTSPLSHRSAHAGARPSRSASSWPPSPLSAAPPSWSSTGPTSSGKRAAPMSLPRSRFTCRTAPPLRWPDARSHGGRSPACAREAASSRWGVRRSRSRGARPSGWCAGWASSSRRRSSTSSPSEPRAGRPASTWPRSRSRTAAPARPCPEATTASSPSTSTSSSSRGSVPRTSASSPGHPCSTSMCGPLCDAVLESEGSGRKLEALYKANLFLVPLDRRPPVVPLSPRVQGLPPGGAGAARADHRSASQPPRLGLVRGARGARGGDRVRARSRRHRPGREPRRPAWARRLGRGKARCGGDLARLVRRVPRPRASPGDRRPRVLGARGRGASRGVRTLARPRRAGDAARAASRRERLDRAVARRHARDAVRRGARADAGRRRARLAYPRARRAAGARRHSCCKAPPTCSWARTRSRTL